MNQRERVLLIGVLTAVILVVGGLLFNWLFLDKLGKIHTEINTLKADIAKKNTDRLKALDDMKALEHDDPRLAQWQELSLPDDNNLGAEIKSGHTADEALKRHVDLVQGDYSHYLYDLVVHSGFTANTIKVSPAPPDRKGGPILTGKTPVYTRVTFTVQAQGKLDAVEALLEDFYKTPLLHEVRNLTLTAKATTPTRTFTPGVARGGVAAAGPGQPGLPIGFPGAAPGLPGAAPGGLAALPGANAAPPGGFRANTAPSGDLDMTMTVEALLVNGAQKRDNLLPKTTSEDKGQVMLLVPDERQKKDAAQPSKDVPQPLRYTLAYAEDKSDSPERRYGDILNKNIFTGVAARSQPTEDKDQVLSVVRLTSIWTSGRHWQATIYDQGKGGDALQLNPDASVAPYDFEVKDMYGNSLLVAKVVKLNADGMIFQPGKLVRNAAGKDVFQGEPRYCRWRPGEYLGKRLRDPNASSGRGNPFSGGGMDIGDDLGMGDDAGPDMSRYYPGALDIVLKPDEIKALGLDDPSGKAGK